MPGVDHSTRIGSVGIKSGSVGITDGDIHITSGSIDTTIIGSVPVYGNFYYGTQDVKVAGSVNIYGSIEVGTVPVTGDFYPSTQPVSGSIGIIEGDIHVTSGSIDTTIIGSVPVYGDMEIGTVPVTGDFYPSTQPVSGSVGIKSGSIGILGGEIKITDGTASVSIDPDSKSMHVIDGEHMHLHTGGMFRTSHQFLSIADDGSADVLIHVGTEPLHCAVSAISFGDAYLRIFEGAIPAYIGTELTINDLNRTTKNTPEARSYHNPAFGTIGNLLDNMIVPGGQKTFAVGDEQRWQTGWILGTFTNYVVELTN